MATASYYSEAPVMGGPTDLGALWDQAIYEYYAECGTDLSQIDASQMKMSFIMAERDQQVLLFEQFRHKGNKVDKLRSFVVKNTDIIQNITTHVTNAASTAIPPCSAILTAFNYVMNASKAVSEDYDLIVSFFELMNSFLERISILENRSPELSPFQRFLMNVFHSMLVLCAIARKYRLQSKGRLVKWAKALVEGNDSKLRRAYDSLHTHLQRFDSITMIATLRQTMDIGKKVDSMGRDLKTIQAGVELSIQWGQQNAVLSQKGVDLGEKNYIVGLEVKAAIKDTAANSQEVLEGIARLSEKMNQSFDRSKRQRDKATEDRNVDAGARKSTALKKLASLLKVEEDDTKRQLEDIENAYVDGTLAWFRDQEVYTNFVDGDAPLLWVTGPPGNGKSTLSFTVVGALQTEFHDVQGTSVAHFFFREDGDDFRQAADMLKSCAMQIATHDLNYRQELLADLQALMRDRDDRLDDVKELWAMLYVSRFAKSSKYETRRLFLVLDGIDEAEEEAVKSVKGFIKQVREAQLNISILFTSDPSTFDEDADGLMLARFTLDTSNANLKNDLRTIALARMKQLSRLKNLRSGARKKIANKLRSKADSIQYVEHMLRRFNAIGREGPILKELDKMPGTTLELFDLLLDECQKSRYDQDLQVLRRFFAWLAYAKEPLRFFAASRLLHFIAKDNTISIDEEVEHKSARLLRLSGAAYDEGRDSDSGDHETDKAEYDASDDDEDFSSVDSAILLGFQGRSLRHYFRETRPDPKGLRTPPSVGHMIIFEAIGAILMDQRSIMDSSYTDQSLCSYAAHNWMSHWLEIDPEELTKDQLVVVVETLYSILSNRNAALKTIEEYSGWSDPLSIFGATEEDQAKALEHLQKWSLQATRLSSPSLTVTTLEWLRPFVRNPRIIYIKTAESHVSNWFLNAYSDWWAEKSFRFAHCALELGKDLIPQQLEQLREYFAEREKEKQTEYTENSVLAVSTAFWQMQMTMTAQCYKSIGMAMKSLDHHEASLKQFNLGMEICDNDHDRLQIYSAMADALWSLTTAAENAARNARAETWEKDGQSMKANAEHGGVAHATMEKAKTDTTKGQDPSKVDHEEEKMKWAQKTCDALAKAVELKITFSEAPDQDMQIKRVLVETYMRRATAEVMLGTTDNVLRYFQDASNIPLKDNYVDLEEAVTRLASKDAWTIIIDLVWSMERKYRVWFAWGLYGDARDAFWRAGKETGELQFVADVYTEGIKAIAGRFKMTYATELILSLGEFYRTVVGGTEGRSVAKPLFHQVINMSNRPSEITDATFRLADILTEDFRTTLSPAKKTSAHAEMKLLVARMRESMGKEFDPTQSQTTIPLALMNRKLAAVDFQSGLDATFKGCVAALQDENSWNDCISFRTLAKVLACMGLDFEAEVAATCQLYIIDLEVHKRENCVVEEKDDSKDKGDSEKQDKDGGGNDGAKDKAAADGEKSKSGKTAKITESDGVFTMAEINGVKEETDVKIDSLIEANGSKQPASIDDILDGDKKTATPSADDAKAKPAEVKAEIDEDLDPVNGRLTCNGCQKTVRDWHHGAMYLCYYCTELNLCEECYHKKAAREKGDLPADWRAICQKGHRHIRAPVKGWKGVRDGVLRFDDREVRFKDWLGVLSEKTWVDAWDRFWSEEIQE